MSHALYSRRRLLRMLGLSGLGLAGLASIFGPGRRASAGPQPSIRRLVIVTWANGVQYPNGDPKFGFWPGLGPIGDKNALPVVSAPLLELPISRICMLHGLTHPAAAASSLTGHEAYLSLLTGTRVSQRGYAGGASFDQIMASLLGGSNLWPSLQLGVFSNPEPVSCPSWHDIDSPLPSQSDPSAVFANVFGGADRAKITALWQARASVLDVSASELTTISAALPPEDRPTFDKHLDELGQLEKQLDPSKLPPASCFAKLAQEPIAPPQMQSFYDTDCQRVADLQAKLLFWAMKCDVTRVALLQYGDSHMDAFTVGAKMNAFGIDTNNSTLNVHLDIAHRGDVKDFTEAKTAYDLWHVQQFVNLVKLFAAESEPGDPSQKMLDNTLFVLINSFANGNSHALDPVPVVLVSGLPGLPYGECHDVGGATLNQLYISLSTILGAPISSIGSKEFGVTGIPGVGV